MQVGQEAYFKRGTVNVPVEILKIRRDFYKGFIECTAKVMESHPEVNLNVGDVIKASKNWFTERQGKD